MELIMKILDFVATNLIIIGAIGLIIDQLVKLTPTEKDDNVWSFIKNLLITVYQFISLPNRKRGGGTHKVNLWSSIGGLLKKKKQ